MRTAGILILCLFALAGCQREPDFDERYDSANENIRKTAAQIDAQISGAPTSSPEEAMPQDKAH